MNISGITFIHNGIEHDYCFEEAIWSMLGCCDEVVCVEAASVDGTADVLRSIQERDKRLRIVQAEWKPAPLVRASNTDWTKDLAELARTSSTYEMILYVQADEVLHEKDYARIKREAATRGTFLFRRLNFWVDPWHIVPPGRVCGHLVCRLAPRTRAIMWGSEGLEDSGSRLLDVDLFHYGFLRNATAFRKKSEIMQKNFIGCVDPIVYEAETHGMQHLRHAWPERELRNFNGTHPQFAKPWLNKHGFDV